MDMLSDAGFAYLAWNVKSNFTTVGLRVSPPVSFLLTTDLPLTSTISQVGADLHLERMLCWPGIPGGFGDEMLIVGPCQFGDKWT